MSSVCIQVINPNTSLAMTETIGAAARAVAAPGTEILAVCPSAGVPSIEGHFDEAIAAVGGKSVLVLTGKGQKTLQNEGDQLPEGTLVFDNLMAFSQYIMQQQA